MINIIKRILFIVLFLPIMFIGVMLLPVSWILTGKEELAVDGICKVLKYLYV